MPRKIKPTISAELRELIDDFPELENPDGETQIDQWNAGVRAYADGEPNAPSEKHLRRMAAAIIHGGKHPKDVPIPDLIYMIRGCPSLVNIGTTETSIKQKSVDRVKGPLTAIRAYCIDCMGGSTTMVRDCTDNRCAHWPFRMGNNPFFGKIADADAEVSEDEIER